MNVQHRTSNVQRRIKNKQQWGTHLDCLLTIVFNRRDGENAKKRDIFLSADPEGIGSAFHGAEEGRKKKITF